MSIKSTRLKKRILALILMIALLCTSMDMEAFYIETKASDDVEMTTLYLVDNTNEKWIGNDNAVIELVDNTNGHKHYTMKKNDDTSWSVEVPDTAYNITFNRLNPSDNTQWNSWSAGGRDDNNAYFADGAEYGHWDNKEIEEDIRFRAGDIVYLDLSAFTDWENSNAIMYTNFTDATKDSNAGRDIDIATADKNLYNPRLVNVNVQKHIYAYILSKNDDGTEKLRFWRGNDRTLWNYSVELTCEEYEDGINCVKVYGWNDSGTKYKSDYSFDLEVDTDGDGLPDYNEIKLGTDINNPDTDGDGLNDYYEIEYGYSPTNPDTDGNGVLDGDEDYDGDKLRNSEEFIYGTDMAKYDTDEDGISDYDEIFVYGTNPLKSDTDEDGVIDSDEIDIGTNPLEKDSDGNGINDNEEVFEKDYSAKDMITYYDTDVYPTINVEGTINVLESVTIDTRDWDTLINCNVPGYIGTAYEFNCDGEFESATVTFTLSEEIMSKPDFVPAIYYYNEEEQYLDKLENQTINGNNITAKLEHFSSYIVLNSKEFDEIWDTEIIHYSDDELKKPLKIGFAVDCSGSMSWNDPAYLRNSVSNLIIDKMDEKDSGFVVLFESYAYLEQSVTTDKSLLKNAINSSYNSGGTALCLSVERSIAQFDEADIKNNRNIIMILSDGYDNEGGQNISTLVNMANRKKIKIYSIGLGSDVDINLLTQLAEQTGGKFYHATAATDLEDIYKQIGGETVDYKKDSNNDGISDYYTKLLCEGKLRTGTGIKLFDCIMNKEANKVLSGYTYEQVQENNDLDGDGLKNGEEIEVVSNHLGTYVFMKSNPTKKMSDMDIYSDYDEVKKYNSNAFKNNICLGDDDIKFLRDDSNYYSSMYSDAYSGASIQSITSWIGRTIYGTDLDKKEISEDLLLDYFSYRDRYSVSDNMESVLTLGNAIGNIESVVEKITRDGAKYVELTDDLIDLNYEYNKLLDAYFIVREGVEVPHLDKNLIRIADKIDDILAKESSIQDTISTKITLKIKLPKAMCSSNVIEVISSIGWICEGASLVRCLGEGYLDYLTMQENLNVMQENLDLLNAISEKAPEWTMRAAAKKLNNVLEDKYNHMWLTFKEEFQNTWGDLAKIGMSSLASKLNPAAIIAIVSVSMSNVITGYSDTSLKAIRTYEAGYIPEIMCDELNKSDYGYSLYQGGIRSYYENSTEAYGKYIDIIALRIFAENEMIALEKSGSKWLNKLWDTVGIGAGSNRKEIIADCKNMIKTLNGMLSRLR